MNPMDANGNEPAPPAGDPPVLAGVRVLDMSRVLAGPWAAQLLADFGAEVIKLERPGAGDESRSWEPSFAAPGDPGRRESAYFCSANRGKRSVTVDHATPAGGDLVRELAAGADVLIENYKVGTLARYGLGYADLAAVNPRLVYVSVTGFGQTGPYRGRAGYDTIIQALGGMMSITGERDGQPGASPQRAGLPVIDLMTGIYAALGVLGALRQRETTGRGQHIDLGLLDVHVSALSYFGMNYLASGVVPQRTGNANPVTYPSGTFRSADRQIVMLVGNDAQFRRFCATIGAPRLPEDDRFGTSALRVRHRDALEALIAPLLVLQPAAHWIAALEAVGVPCAPINDLAAVFGDPQVVARGDVAHVRHSALGEIPVLASPLRMSAAPIRYDVPPPVLGEHTEDVLRGVLGLSDAQIAGLRALKVI
jgi:crotonobetainyl-CoA:carnitine CoA-transferase CaiB-like acyl-CoA transferase